MAVYERISLRSARKDESAALSELCLRSKAIWGYDRDFLETCRDELSVGEAAIKAGLVTVAETGSNVVGTAELSFEDGIAYLEKLFVDPGILRCGAGRMLFDRVRQMATELGAHELVIEADPDAVPFYMAMGCESSGTAPSGSIPGRVLPRLVCTLSGQKRQS